jgi:hypothetical protein
MTIWEYFWNIEIIKIPLWHILSLWLFEKKNLETRVVRDFSFPNENLEDQSLALV